MYYINTNENTKPFHFNSFLVWKAQLILLCIYSKGDIFARKVTWYFISVYIINVHYFCIYINCAQLLVWCFFPNFNYMYMHEKEFIISN